MLAIIVMATAGLLCAAQPSRTTIYITPSSSSIATSSTCPGSSSCYNLETYLLGISSGNISGSNATVLFLPGIHVFSTGVALFQDVANLQLSGSVECLLAPRTIAQQVLEYGFKSYLEDDEVTFTESSAVIECDTDNPAGFVFVNVTNLVIANLTIRGCGLYTDVTLGNASVHMVNVTDVLIDTISIQNGRGYGLLGENVLGRSRVVGSSFVGNNQRIKGALNGTTFYGLGCYVDKETVTKGIPAFTNDGSLDYASVAGGNVYFRYQDPSPFIDGSQNQLIFSACLFSLGVDGTLPTLASGILSSKCWIDYNCPGTGLTIFMTQSSYEIDIAITNTTSYRNQALFGANVHIRFDPAVSTVTMMGVSSTRALGEWSGALFDTADQQLGATSRSANASVSVIDSMFACNVSPDNDSTVSISLYKPGGYNLSAYIEDCRFQQTDVSIQALVTQADVRVVNCSFQLSDVTIFGLSASFDGCSFGEFTFVTLDGNYASPGSPDLSFFDSVFVQSYLSIKGSHTKPIVIVTNSTFSNSQILTSEKLNMQLTLRIAGSFFDSSYVYVTGGPLQSSAFITDSGFYASKVDSSNSDVYLGGSVSFTDMQSDDYGGALSLYSSTLVFLASSIVLFSNNSAAIGGALYLDEASLLNLTSPTTVIFIGNNAVLFGGAIYVQSQSLFSSPRPDFVVPKCFIQLLDSEDQVKLYFEGNTAGEAGSLLYGGSIDACRGNDVFRTIFSIGSSGNMLSLISSDPKYLCPCEYGANNISTASTMPVLSTASLRLPPCNTNITIYRTVYSGEKLELPFVTIGQANGTAPGIVLIYTSGRRTSIISALRSTGYCSMYNIPYLLANGKILYFTTQASFSDGLSSELNVKVSVTVLPCPSGFELSNGPSCTCSQLLQRYNFICDISTQTVTKSGSWVGPVANGSSTLGVKLQCPYDYCKAEGIINVTNFDDQCAYNREKVLCGQCKEGLSMMFGTSQCTNCSNYSILLLVPFALLGVALVGLLFLLNLTISTGSVNGLIFYANIVRIGSSIFFPQNRWNVLSRFLSVFIAWLNLDFGIEACFYSGMDGYAKTWLQFVFPLYIYSLVGVIVLAGRYSFRISGLLQRCNVVSILASLILLSYSKVLRTVITIFSFTSIDTFNTTTLRAWRYDGNIQFLGPKHSVLFTVGLGVTVLFIFPYITTLLFIPCLQSRSHHKIFKWVNKLKPFFDSYAAAYKDKYRYWCGVLLAIRLPIYLLFALDFSTNVQLLGIVLATSFYTVFLNMFSVYKKRQHLVNETFFQMNLMVLAIVLLFNTNSKVSLTSSAFLMVGAGSAFLFFVLIVALHICTNIRKKGNVWRKFKVWLTKRFSTRDKTAEVELEPYVAEVNALRDDNDDLRESLLVE